MKTTQKPISLICRDYLEIVSPEKYKGFRLNYVDLSFTEKQQLRNELKQNGYSIQDFINFLNVDVVDNRELYLFENVKPIDKAISKTNILNKILEVRI